MVKIVTESQNGPSMRMQTDGIFYRQKTDLMTWSLIFQEQIASKEKPGREQVWIRQKWLQRREKNNILRNQLMEKQAVYVLPTDVKSGKETTAIQIQDDYVKYLIRTSLVLK